MNFQTLIGLSNGELAARVAKTSVVNELCTYGKFELLTELKKRQARRAVKRADIARAVRIVSNEIGAYEYVIDRTRRM